MFIGLSQTYARNDILKEEYGFDNSDFLGALRQRDYFVANEAYSNVNSTKPRFRPR